MRALATLLVLAAIGLGVPLLVLVAAAALFGDPSVRELLDRFPLPPGAVETRRYEDWQDGVKPAVASVWFSVPAAEAAAMPARFAARCGEIGVPEGPVAPVRKTANGGAIHLVCDGQKGSRALWVELFHRCGGERCDAMLDVFSFHH